MVGRQCPILAFFIPFLLVVMASGVRSVRGAWPAALTAGGTFAVMQFVTSNYISAELTDIIASLSSAAALLALMQVWSPAAPLRSDEEVPGTLPPLAGASPEDVSLARRTRAEEGRADPPRRDVHRVRALHHHHRGARSLQHHQHHRRP